MSSSSNRVNLACVIIQVYLGRRINNGPGGLRGVAPPDAARAIDGRRMGMTMTLNTAVDRRPASMPLDAPARVAGGDGREV